MGSHHPLGDNGGVKQQEIRERQSYLVTARLALELIASRRVRAHLFLMRRAHNNAHVSGKEKTLQEIQRESINGKGMAGDNYNKGL